MTTYAYNSTGVFKVTILSIDGEPMTGLAPTVRIVRMRDGFEFDYSILQFVPSGTAVNPYCPLVEELPLNPGTYFFEFDQAAYDPSAPGTETYDCVFRADPFSDEASENYQFTFLGTVCKMFGEVLISQSINGSIELREFVDGVVYDTHYITAGN